MFFLTKKILKEKFDNSYWNLIGQGRIHKSLSLFYDFLSLNTVRHYINFFQSKKNLDNYLTFN